MAIKILISGYENSGKSTLAAQIEDSLVLNCDLKEYTFKRPHANIVDWEGAKQFTKLANDKIVAYKTKFKKLPNYLIIDTITQLYMKMNKFNGETHTTNKFEIHTQNNSDTLALNDYFEKVIIAKGINLIIVAHTILENDTHKIPATGAFKNAGSWLSVVNEAIFINKNAAEHKIYLRDNFFPCRTLLDIDKNSVDITDFNINDHLAKLTTNKQDVEQFKL